MKNSSSGSHFLSRFLRYLLEFFFTPTTCGFILVGGGGGEAYFSKKTNLFDFDRLFSFIYKQASCADFRCGLQNCGGVF